MNKKNLLWLFVFFGFISLGFSADWVYTGTSYNISSETINGVDILNDGTNNWLLSSTSTVYKYDSTWNYQNISKSLNAQDNEMYGISWNGTHYYTVGKANDLVYVYNSTWGYTGTSYNISSQDTIPTDIEWDGTYFYVVGDLNNAVYRYYQNMSYTGTSWSISSQDTQPQGILWDGTYWWIVGRANDKLYKYNTSWNIIKSIVVSSEDTQPIGITKDNNNWYLLGADNDFVYKYQNQTGGIISTLTISPSSPNYLSNLSFTNSTTNTEGIITYQWKWFKNGAVQSSLENISTVTSGNLTIGQNWTISLRINDDSGWSNYTNSSQVTIADNISPTIENDSLSASSGTNDDPFTINVDIYDISTISFVKVEVINPNSVATNFSMTTADNITYSKVYTPSTDGIYTFKFFAGDTYGNNGSLTSVLTYTESTFTNTTTGGGGGGGTSIDLSDEDDDKLSCDISFSIEQINFTENNLFQTIVLKNNEDLLYNPIFSVEYVSGDENLVNSLRFTNTIDEIESNFSANIGLRFNTYQVPPGVAEAKMVVTSTKCKRFEIPISINIQEKTSSIGTFFNEFEQLSFLDKFKKSFDLRFTEKFNVEDGTLIQKFLNRFLSVGGITTFLSIGIGIILLFTKSLAKNPITNLISKTILFNVLTLFTFVVTYVVRFFTL